MCNVKRTSLDYDHAFIAIHKGVVFFRLGNDLGHTGEGSEPYAIGNTRNHTCMEDALESVKRIVRSYGVTDDEMEINDYRNT